MARSSRQVSSLLAVHESFPPMYGDQVIRWTQRKRQAENLGGGGLRVVLDVLFEA